MGLQHKEWDGEIGVCECHEPRSLFPSKMSLRDEVVLEQTIKAMTRNSEGRYVVPLPAIQADPVLDNNFDQALVRLTKTYKRLKNQGLDSTYAKLIKEQLDLGIIEEVPEVDKAGYYMPHRPVIRSTSTTTKVRIIYDASAVGVEGRSVNGMLEAGPSLYPELCGLLLRFRRYEFVVTADIEKAFHQVMIQEDHRHWVRFLWFINNNLTAFQFTRLPFGLVCSPFLLGVVIKEHLKLYKNIAPSVVAALQGSLYVDDLLVSLKSEQECLQLFNQTVNIFEEGKLPMRKWFSNSPLTRNQLSDHLGDAEQKGFLLTELLANDRSDTTSEDVKVLGISWNAVEDVLWFDSGDIVDEIKTMGILTKRKLFSISARLFDPLGLVSPILTPIRKLVQDLWAEKLGWDDEIKAEHCKLFSRWGDSVARINQLRWERWSGEKSDTQVEIHVFSDAGDPAYAAALYKVCFTAKGWKSTLLCAKIKMCPLKTPRSMPLLELMGACLAIRLFEYARAQGGFDSSIKANFWVDASAVLNWINNPRVKMEVFGRNRVSFILQHSVPSQWRYCPSEENPADLPSKGCSLMRKDQFLKWVHGPKFLSREAEWPIQPVTTSSIDVSDPVNIDNSEFWSARSSYRGKLRLISLVLKAKRLFLKPIRGNVPAPTDVEQASEAWVMGKIQQIYLGEDLKQLQDKKFVKPGSRIAALNPVLDSEGLIRVGGRRNLAETNVLDNCPVILPSNNSFVRALLRKEHLRLCHAGVSTMLGILRGKIWLLNGRVMLKKIIKGCPVCNRYQARPFNQPQAPLPDFRVIASRPFQSVGIDFFGPLLQPARSKVYGVLFTCATYRGVHIELVKDMTAATFWRALRRFCARKGRPDLVYSDNATTFVKCRETCKVLDAHLKQAHKNQGLRIKWDLITPRAPWWGGFYERMVGSAKKLLLKQMHRVPFNIDEISTVLVEVESIINDRPLSYFAEQDPAFTIITPSILMYGRVINALPAWGSLRKGVALLGKNFPSERAKLMEKWLGQFWEAWRRQYINSLQENRNYRCRGSTPRIDQVVLLVDPNVKRGFWKMGKVSKLFQGRDGRVRAATVKTADGEFQRAIQSLVPLEWDLFHDGP